MHHKKAEYVVCFQVPDKEYSDQPTFKALSQASRYDSYRRTNYTYDEKRALDFSKKFIDVFAIQKSNDNDSIAFIPAKIKQDILKRLSVTYYTVNGLVNVASDGRISNFISGIIMDNKKLSSIPRFVNYQYKSLASWVKKAEESVGKRRSEIDEILGLFNETQQNKLRIVRRDNLNPVSQDLIDDMIQGKAKYYRGFNILRSSVIDYVEEVLLRYGFEDVIKMYIKREYTVLLSAMPIRDYAEQKTQYQIEQNYRDVIDEAEMQLIELLFGDMFSNDNLDLWNSIARQYYQNEAYDLEFNINNKEKSTDDKAIFRKVRSLSLGQKVVAMLSFILSYSQYSGDFSPLIIDQPEDNLDNQYVFKNLIKDLRDIKDTRQVIMATHSSTIVTNAKAEQVIVMESDNKHAWLSARGFPSEKVIVQHILNYLEGGKESFKHKALLYNDVL